MLIDSNILIYSLALDSPKNHVAQDFLKEQLKKSKLVVAHQNIFETLRVITHLKFPNSFTAQEGNEAINQFLLVSKVIYPTKETLDIALALIKKYTITGSEIFDAYLVATVLSNGVSQIASDNEKHLLKYSEIKVVNPF